MRQALAQVAAGAEEKPRPPGWRGRGGENQRAPARRWATSARACVPRGEEESLSDQAPGMQRRTLLRNSALAGGGAALAAALAACGKSSSDDNNSSSSNDSA